MKQLHFHFDYACPWCYIGAYAVRELEQEGVRVHYHPWKMPPNANPPAKPEGYYDGARQRLRELRTEMNIVVSSPVQEETGRALMATKIAEEMGRAAAYVEAVFRAHWAEKQDIFATETLVAIAGEVGLDTAAFAERLEADAGREGYEADLIFAADHNIDSIPSYRNGDKRLIVHHYDDMPTLESLRALAEPSL